MLRRALKVANLVMLLPIFYYERSARLLQLAVERAVQDKRRAELSLIEEYLHDRVVLIVERGCNYRIFDEMLEEENVGALKKMNGRFQLDCKLREELFRGETRDGQLYVSLSPYLRIPVADLYTTTLHCRDKIDSSIEKCFLKIFGLLKKSGTTSFDLDEMTYRRQDLRRFSYYKFYCEEIGRVENTKYFEKNRILSSVEEIAVRYERLKRSMTKCEWMSGVVDEIMKLLHDLRAFRDNVDLVEYPDLIPLIMPFQMINVEYPRWSYVEIVNVGFDLRCVKDSELAFLFDQEVLKGILEDGGAYIVSRII